MLFPTSSLQGRLVKIETEEEAELVQKLVSCKYP
jgi:hypothetical protein